MHHNCRTHAQDLGVSPGDIHSVVDEPDRSLIPNTGRRWALSRVGSDVGPPALCGSAMRTRKQTLQEKPRLHSPRKKRSRASHTFWHKGGLAVLAGVGERFARFPAAVTRRRPKLQERSRLSDDVHALRVQLPLSFETCGRGSQRPGWVGPDSIAPRGAPRREPGAGAALRTPRRLHGHTWRHAILGFSTIHFLVSRTVYDFWFPRSRRRFLVSAVGGSLSLTARPSAGAGRG